jgi:predicted transcriptional regulator
MSDVEVKGATSNLVPLTVQIVSAFVKRNQVAANELQGVIQGVFRALESTREVPEAVVVPAVPIKKSVQPSAITCLDCGKTFTAVRRHLLKAHGLTPDDYRKKWDLAPNYPLVAPEYSKVRSRMAKEIGLGQPAAAATAAPQKPAAKRKAKKAA